MKPTRPSRRPRMEFHAPKGRLDRVTVKWKAPDLKVKLPRRREVQISDRDYQFPSYLFQPVGSTKAAPTSLAPPAPRVRARVESVTVELFDEELRPLPFTAELSP